MGSQKGRDAECSMPLCFHSPRYKILSIIQVMGNAHYLSEPALPEVPGYGSRPVAGAARDRTSARSLFPRRVHVAFPAGRLALQNPKVIYDILFRTAAATLLETAADPRLLGAHIGFLAVLHTCLLRA
jgi:hypothetical protein